MWAQVHGEINATGSNSTAIGIMTGNLHLHQPRQRVEWPVRVGVPHAPADHYQERQAHTELVDTLAAGHSVVLVGAGRRAGVVVSGMGGVGKTQLAAHHAWQVWPDAELDLAMWVSALSRDAIVTTYAEAASRVLVEQDPRITDRSPDEAARLFRGWLAATPRRWLVVLDDVQDPADLRGLEPPPSTRGQVVVTSRRRDAALTRGGHRVIELNVFTPDEALTYLTEALVGTIDGGDRDLLAGLAEDLGWLPLALSQAAAYLADQPLLTITAYRGMLADRHRTLAELTPHEQALPEHQLTVAVTWSVSVDRADRVEDPARPRGAGLARPLLEIAALLDPNGIPLTAFTAQPVLDHLTTLTGRPVEHDDVHDGLTRLHRFNLITLVPGHPERAVAVHALVQRTVRDRLAPAQLHTLTHVIAIALWDVWPHNDTIHSDLAQTLRSNGEVLRARTALVLFIPETHPLLLQIGLSLRATGQVHSTAAYWQALLDQMNTCLGPDHSDTLFTRGEIAVCRGEAGDPVGAVAELTVLLEDQSRVLGHDHLHTLTTRHHLSIWKGEAGDLAGAVAELEAVLQDRSRVLGEGHPHILSSRTQLAIRRGKAGDPKGAVTELEALWPDLSRILGENHPETLTARHNLAWWRGEAGDLAGSIAEFEALLEDYSRMLGRDNPDTFFVRHGLAATRGTAGDPAGAVAEFEALLADVSRVLGKDHLRTLSTRHNLAEWRGDAGDLAGAVAEFEALLADVSRVLGEDHLFTFSTRRKLAEWQGEATGNPVGAVTELDALLADQSRVLGMDHPETRATRERLVWWRGTAGDLVGAITEAEELLADQSRVLGEDHLFTLSARHSLVWWRGTAGDLVGAITEAEELLADQSRVLGRDRPETLATRDLLAYWRREAGDLAGAITELEALLTDQSRVLGMDHPGTLATRHSLANCRGEAGDPASAVTELEGLLAELPPALGKDDPLTLSARRSLAWWQGKAG